MAKKTTQELLEKLDGRIDDVKNSEEFQNMLEFFSKFHNYSYHKTILIQMQKPDSTYVAGYRQWQDKFNRQVKKGEKGISILAPYTYQKEIKEIEEVEVDGEIMETEVEKTITKTYFRPVYVFDVSQTVGEPLPAVDIGVEDEFSELLEPLTQFTFNQGIKLDYKSLSEGCNGYSNGGKIIVDKEVNNTEKASILLHELAHELLHNEEDRIKLSREIRELEAEAVAFVAMDHYGLEIKSDKYLALYKKDYDLKDSLKRIHQTATKIIGYCDECLSNNKKGNLPRGKPCRELL